VDYRKGLGQEFHNFSAAPFAICKVKPSYILPQLVDDIEIWFLSYAKLQIVCRFVILLENTSNATFISMVLRKWALTWLVG
jgi:hypothetical protein